MGKSKDTERQNAKLLYIEQYKTAKEIASLIGVDAKTVGGWIVKYNWKAERDARVTGPKNQIASIKELIALKSERAIDLEKAIHQAMISKDAVLAGQLREESIALGDEVSKWNKTLENLDRSNRVSLSTYIDVLDNIFKSMQRDYPEVYTQTIDFQEKHLNEISLKYG